MNRFRRILCGLATFLPAVGIISLLAGCPTSTAPPANSAPSASFPDWDYEVQGAGTAAVNGRYVQNGTYSAVDRYRYTHSGGGYELFNTWDSGAVDGLRHWVINTALTIFVDVTTLPYHAVDATLRPPQTGWQVGSGGTPAPTLLRMPISGDTAALGSQLTGHYLYSDPDGDAEGASTYQWFRCSTAADAGVPISGATGLSYTTVAADDGAYLRFQVTPVDSQGNSGTPVKSSAVGVGSASAT